MTTRPAKTLLLIENQPEEARLIREMLNDPNLGVFELALVESVSDAEKYLAGQSVDIVLLDMGLVNPTGLEAVKRVRAAAPRVSIVVLSSADDEQIAVQAIQEGAQDYLIKGQIEPRELMRALLNAAERKIIEEIHFAEQGRAQATLDSIGDAIICTDASDNITFLNHVAETMTGWRLKDAAGRSMAETIRIVDATTRQPIMDPMAKAASQNQKGNLPLDCILISREGSEVSIEDSVAPIHNREGQVTGAVIVFRDVSATRALQEELTHSSQHDFLTGLPNRKLLNDRVDQAISLARRQRCQAAVLFLDLDGFKHINDSLGHLIGDKVLKSVAKRLQDCLRSPDSVIRLGGDEFIVVLQELKRPEDAEATVERLMKAVTAVHSIDEHEISLTASIGVSVYPADGKDAVTLISNADTAMYFAKKNGKHNHRLFRPDMINETVKCQSIEQDLRLALERNEFSLYYQPRIDLRSGAVIGAEALSRWNNPGRGLVPPAQFIPIAEECGLIVPVGKWILHEACAQAQAWADAGEPLKMVIVNISGIQLLSDRFLDSLFETLTETRLNPRSLELDVTESVLRNSPEDTARVLRVLRDKGVKVSVDNFGTSHTTLSSLKKLPLDALKMDRSFVSRITGTPDNATAKVSSMIDLGRDLHLRVIAEGVESVESLEFLWAHNCDEAVGYYFGQPVPAGQFGEKFQPEKSLRTRNSFGVSAE